MMQVRVTIYVPSSFPCITEILYNEIPQSFEERIAHYRHLKIGKCIVLSKAQRASIFCYHTVTRTDMVAVLCTAELCLYSG